MTKVPLVLALSGCSSQFLGLLSANIPATCLLSLGFILLNVGDQPRRWSLRDGCVMSLSTQQSSFPTPLETPAWWDGDEMMFLISRWCQQLVTLVLQMNIPGSFSSLPSFHSARLRNTADRVVISPSSAAAFHSLYDSLMVKGASSSSVRSLGFVWLHHREGSWGRDFPAMPQGEGKTYSWSCITFQSKCPRDGWLLPRKLLRSFLFPS